jgi:YidC/Oxa1 family membrane protein insertase
MPSLENLRPFLWAALVSLLFMNYTAWQKDHPAAPATVASAANAPATDTFAQSVPTVPTAPEGVPAPTASAAPAPGAEAAALSAAAVPVAAAVVAEPVPTLIHVKTDVLDLTVSTRGGDLVGLDLSQYPLHKKNPEEKVRLFDGSSEATRYVHQGGLVTGGAALGKTGPSHLAIFTAQSSNYALADGENELRVPLTWTDGAGLTVMRTYVFKRGQYAVTVESEVQNASNAAVNVAPYSQILRRAAPVESSMFNPETYAYRGPAVYDGEKYSKLKVTDDESRTFQKQIKGGWFAAMQHYFVTAIVPPVDEAWTYALKINGDDALLQTAGPSRSVAAGTSAKLYQKLYMGPKLQDQLVTAGPRLDLSVDYGKLTLIAEPLFWVLKQVHKVVTNWGLTIILVTLLIKLVFYKLAETSGRSMARMRNIQPRMKALQERYADNREELGKQMMELYKREKVNPVAGCLPMLVQIPFFIAFYWVLMESVEMRQASFYGWLNDLSSMDPYYILPIVMAGAMFLQFKLNPAPADPVQAKVFAFMPLVMAVTMAWFPSGLLLYWITNTGLSILQQWHINRVVERETPTKA